MSATISQTVGKIRLRSPRIAARAFGLDKPGQLVTAVPRMKFMFFTEFVLSPAGLAMTNNADLNTYNGNRGLSFKVKQVDKPKVTLNTQDLNQYNKKKIVYTKAEYGEASMRIYDTVDDSVLATWIDYFTYYFGDSRAKQDQQAYEQSPVDARFVDDSGWGLRPLSNDTQFFNQIIVYAFYARTYTAFSYVNPKITSIDWQQRDYSSNDFEEVGINFKYEAIEYEAFGQTYDPRKFGWLPTDALDEIGTIPNLPTPPRPRIFSTQASSVLNILPQTATTQNQSTLLPQSVLPISVAPLASVPIPNELESTVAGGIPRFGTSAVTSSISSITSLPTIAPPGNAVAASSQNQTQVILQQREQTSRLTDAAVASGLVPAGSTAIEQITGRIEAGDVVTSVTINGQTRNPPLSTEDSVRVERARRYLGGQ